MGNRLYCWLGVLCLAFGVVDAQVPCQTAPATVSSVSLDMAPPPGYVEICSQDEELCRRLTAGYPPSVTTLGYFVPADEWQAYKASSRGFAHYLIAQLANSTSANDLPGLKQYLHAQQGSIPDHSRVPAILDSNGRVPLGIFDETDSSISFGIIMKLRLTTDTTPAVALVSTNSAVVARNHLLSVYVFREFHESTDVDAAERLTRDWVSCIRHAN